MGGGAWPFLVGGAICLVNSDNARDSSLLNRWRVFIIEISGSELVGTRVGVAARWVPCQQSSNTWSNDEVDFIFVFLLVNSDAGVELYLKFIRLVLIMRSFGLMNFFFNIRVTKSLEKVLGTLVKPLTTFPYMRRTLGLDLSSMGSYGTKAPAVPALLPPALDPPHPLPVYQMIFSNRFVQIINCFSWKRSTWPTKTWLDQLRPTQKIRSRWSQGRMERRKHNLT